MRVVSDADEARAIIRAWRKASSQVALVPTMGGLHAGHMALVARARELADKVAVSVFVNRRQFDCADDYENYPRNIHADTALLKENRVDLMFAPSEDELFRSTSNARRAPVPAWNDFSRGVVSQLEGRSRDGFFEGVVAAVTALYAACPPDIAVYGAKDYQQLLLMRELVRRMDLKIRIVDVPTVRESDGLAISSRNRRLSDEQRVTACGLYRVLRHVATRIRAGEKDFRRLEDEGCECLKQAGLAPDYVAVRRADDLGRAESEEPQSPQANDAPRLIALGAASIGAIRLIDNVPI